MTRIIKTREALILFFLIKTRILIATHTIEINNKTTAEYISRFNIFSRKILSKL